MTTENIKELSKKLAEAYGVEMYHYDITETEHYLVEDSGLISDLADDNNISTHFGHDEVCVFKNAQHDDVELFEQYADHPTKHDAAKMARVRCLLAIKGYME